MKYLKPLLFYVLVMLFFVYLPNLVGIRLTIAMEWGMDGFFSILFISQISVLVALIFWMRWQQLSWVFRFQKWRWSYLLWIFLGYMIYRFDVNIHYFHSDWFHPVDEDAELMRPILRVLPTYITIVMSFLTSVITGSIFEEVFHRGYLMNVIFPKSKYYLDVILSAILFAGSHLILVDRSVVGFALFTLMGLFLGAVYRFTKNLYLCIFCHMLFNLMSFGQPLWIFLYNWIYYQFFR